jgi:hypothetical protein
MSVEERRPRPVHFPQPLWDLIDKDAKRHKRSGVKHMEWILEAYFGMFDLKQLNREMERAIDDVRKKR